MPYVPDFGYLRKYVIVLRSLIRRNVVYECEAFCFSFALRRTHVSYPYAPDVRSPRESNGKCLRITALAFASLAHLRRLIQATLELPDVVAGDVKFKCHAARHRILGHLELHLIRADRLAT